jgi:hypothetical protein
MKRALELGEWRLRASHEPQLGGRLLLEDPNLRLWLLGHTARRFGLHPDDPSGVAVTPVAPQFFGDGDRPDALAAVRAWTAGLSPALDRQDAHVAAGHLAALEMPVTLVFGAAVNYLNPDLPASWPACSGTPTCTLSRAPATGPNGTSPSWWRG